MLHFYKYFSFTLPTLAILLATVAPSALNAAPLDLATIPLSNSPSVPIQSNLLYIFDDSGSMQWGFLPDTLNTGPVPNDTGVTGLSDQRRGCASEINGMAYNPIIVYTPPPTRVSPGNTPIDPTSPTSKLRPGPDRGAMGS